MTAPLSNKQTPCQQAFIAHVGGGFSAPAGRFAARWFSRMSRISEVRPTLLLGNATQLMGFTMFDNIIDLGPNFGNDQPGLATR
jgi:hypothetical protein